LNFDPVNRRKKKSGGMSHLISLLPLCSLCISLSCRLEYSYDAILNSLGVLLSKDINGSLCVGFRIVSITDVFIVDVVLSVTLETVCQLFNGFVVCDVIELICDVIICVNVLLFNIVMCWSLHCAVITLFLLTNIGGARSDRLAHCGRQESLGARLDT